MLRSLLLSVVLLGLAGCDLVAPTEIPDEVVYYISSNGRVGEDGTTYFARRIAVEITTPTGVLLDTLVNNTARVSATVPHQPISWSWQFDAAELSAVRVQVTNLSAPVQGSNGFVGVTIMRKGEIALQDTTHFSKAFTL